MNVLARNDQEYAFKAENMISRTKDTLDFIPRFLAMAEVETSFTLPIWLNENVGFHPAFSRHGRGRNKFHSAHLA